MVKKNTAEYKCTGHCELVGAGICTGFIFSEVFYACPARRKPRGRPGTDWWDYISHVPLEQLTIYDGCDLKCFPAEETNLTNYSLIQTHYSFLLSVLRVSFLWSGITAMCSSWFTLTNVLAHYSLLSANYIHTL